jgi:hypothetical protein
MSERSTIPLPESLIDDFAKCLDEQSLRSLASLKLSVEAQQKLNELADKANDGVLSSAERDEYQAFIAASELVGLAQLRAKARLGLPLV